MNLFFQFLQPYAAILLGMAYSLQQALEGLGIHQTRFEPVQVNKGMIVSALNVSASLASPFAALLVLSVLWIVIVGRALQALWGRGAMRLGLLLLFIPGVLSVADLWPHIQWLPRKYLIGSGHTGSPWGMLLLQVFAMTAGWALTVWLTYRLKLDDRFRHGYDQFWYAMAMAAGLFFVADLDASDQRDELRASTANSRAASSYLLNQARQLDEACQSGKIALPLACRWAGHTQSLLEQYAQYGDALYWQLGPEHEERIYADSDTPADDRTVDALRQELQQYNLLMCPITDLGGGAVQVSRVSRTCRVPPAEFCQTFPGRRLPGLDPGAVMLRTVAIANECIAPTLYRLKVQQASLAPMVGDHAKARHLRTVFFLFIALIAGGKVANASVRMTEAIRKARADNAALGHATGPEAPWPIRLRAKWRCGNMWVRTAMKRCFRRKK
ncbi:hypothetical protein [Paracidovorax oryzae]|uniref:hypothetical protein n=1 Tax=Paracidovorax oryzae TaxID=862720 RepID=UPI0035CE94BB